MSREIARRIYDQLWLDASAAFDRGSPELDSHLLHKSADQRRGLSLILRPSDNVRDAIKNFLDRLAIDFPGQYFYQPEEFHVTVLTLISATALWRREIHDVRALRHLLRQKIKALRPFELEFRGVTATPGVVMIQGFPLGDGLEEARNQLRQAFGENGFSHRLDRRYRSQTAHITAMRFSHGDADWKLLLALLKKNRSADFGGMRIEKLQLVWGDWYASADRLRLLDEFTLV